MSATSCSETWKLGISPELPRQQASTTYSIVFLMVSAVKRSCCAGVPAAVNLVCDRGEQCLPSSQPSRLARQAVGVVGGSQRQARLKALFARERRVQPRSYSAGTPANCPATTSAISCPTCHGTMRVVACLTQASVIDQILAHLRARAAREAHAGPRSPPSTRAPASRNTSRTPRPSADAPTTA